MVIAAQILWSLLALTANLLTVPSEAVEKVQGSSLPAEMTAARDAQNVSSIGAVQVQQGAAMTFVTSAADGTLTILSEPRTEELTALDGTRSASSAFALSAEQIASAMSASDASATVASASVSASAEQAAATSKSASNAASETSTSATAASSESDDESDDESNAASETSASETSISATAVSIESNDESTAAPEASTLAALEEKLLIATPLQRDTIRVHYRWSNSEIDTLYKDNGAALRSLKDLLGNGFLSVDTLYIYSSSSSEGGAALNARLSQKRGEALRDQLVQLRNGQKFAGVNIMPLGANYPEFLERLKAADDLPDKSETVAGYETDIQVYGNDAAFRRLMKYRSGVPYAYIKQNILPEMRYADLVLVSHVIFEEVVTEEDIDIPLDTFVVEDRLPLVEPLVWPKPQPVDSVAVHWYPAVKTNLLYDLVTAVNVELEFPIGDRFSIAVEDDFPWWNWGPNGKKYCFQIWNIGVEPRWWFLRDDRRDWLTGHFAGIYAMSGKYDFQWDQKFCWQGEHWSAGLTYGYALPICKWANMEFSVSVGYLHSDYRHYQPDDDYEHLFRDYYNSGRVTWFGPTKAKISLVIPLGRDSHTSKAENGRN